MGFSTDSRLFPAAVLIVLLGLALPAAADPYVVRDFAVERQARSAAEARDAALAEAIEQAFRVVMDRLLPKAELVRLDLSAGVAREALDNIAIMSETAAGASYRARLTLAFSRERVGRALRARGVVPVVGAAPPVLVIPVLVEEGVPHLWSDAAAWKDALAASAHSDAIAPLRLPDGSYADRAAPPPHVLSHDHMTMELFRLRYGVQGVVLAFVEQVPGGEDQRLRLHGDDAVGVVRMERRIAGGLAEAAGAVHGELAERWKAGGIRGDGTGGGEIVISGPVGLPPPAGLVAAGGEGNVGTARMAP